MFLEGSTFHIKTNENDDTDKNLIKKFKLRLDTIRYRDTSKTHFNKDGKIVYR